jgi:N-dimethylarginine dimethylaminohydrolase
LDVVIGSIIFPSFDTSTEVFTASSSVVVFMTAILFSFVHRWRAEERKDEFTTCYRVAKRKMKLRAFAFIGLVESVEEEMKREGRARMLDKKGVLLNLAGHFPMLGCAPR